MSPLVVRIAILINIVLFAAAMALAAPPPATAPSKGDDPPAPAAARITLTATALIFPEKGAPQIALGPVATSPDAPPPPRGAAWKTAAVSENGQLAAVLDRDAQSIGIYDASGKRSREIKVQSRFAQVHVSNKGMVVATGLVSENELDPVMQQAAAVYDPAGKMIKTFDRLQPGSITVQFFADGTMAVILLPTPSFEVVWADGQAWSRSLIPEDSPGDRDYTIDAVAVDPGRRRLACATLEIGGIGTPPATRLFIYNAVKDNPGQWQWREWTNAGAFLNEGSMAFTPDAKRLIAVEPQLVRCFDVEANRLQQWVELVGHPGLGTIRPQQGRAVYAGAQRVVTAHLAPTGPGWRVLYSVFTPDGKPIPLFPFKAENRMLNCLLSDEVREQQIQGPVWSISADGKTLETRTAPKTTIPLVP